jgi:peptidoglycan/xylan/chitin deacetylase (PgdA/CDA1 family)
MFTLLLVCLTGALALHGYTHHLYGETPDGARTADGGRSTVPAAITSGGPVVDAGPAGARSLRPKPRTIALTFDDGPDPNWTPKVLDLLEQHQVKATFFVVGTQVAEHPDLARRIVAEGHQLGVHTFTHADLGAVPGWRRALELRQTDLIVAGATGVSTPLLRPPYSSEASALTDTEWQAIRDARSAGYLTVLSTLDSEDWRRPGVDRIVANATPKGTAGQVMLMHDAGGDRSQTLRGGTVRR